MSRLPYAAEQLIAQVRQAKPKTKVEPYGDPDGLNVHRSIVFNKATGKWLEPLLEEIADQRLHSVRSTKDGLVVTFVATPRADWRDPFPLDEAQTVRGE